MYEFLIKIFRHILTAASPNLWIFRIGDDLFGPQCRGKASDTRNFIVFISTVFAVTLQFLKGDVLDYAIAGETAQTGRYAVLLIAFILCEIFFYFCYKQFSAGFVVGCTKSLRRDIFDSIMRRDFVKYKEHQQGEYISKLTNEVNAIKTRRFQMLPMLWEILFKSIFVSAALFLLDWRLALITITLLTTPLYVPKLIEKKLQKAQTEYLDSVEDNLAKVNDWLKGFEIIKNFSIEEKILLKFNESNNHSMNRLLKDTALGAVSQLITTLISYLSYFVVLVCAVWLVLQGDFTAGNFFVAIGMIDQLSYPLLSLAEIIRQLIAIRPACDSVVSFMEEGVNSIRGRVLHEVSDRIEYRSVTFAYPDEPPVLHDFNFTAGMGRRYLIKGPSGCGKTTAVNLLLRYHDVNEGSIVIDGVPISEYDSTYGCITVVRQEAVLFHDSLRNNLTMYQDISDDRLVSVLKSLGLDKFANSVSLDALIMEDGANLSGGEKKRICLARALLRDTDILILDEPLANLDDVTAAKIEDILLSIKCRLLIVVSHQFSETRLASFDDVLTFQKM